ncbi:hypothetical protein NMY22_g20051 [Coprinellus aureogranulatus]|nr:hypothetical protein NMY22_g20051 [Coprinellus aureogranulatus]
MDSPIADPLNPCYCPALPAATFLQELRRAMEPGTTSDRRSSFFSAFARILEPHGSVDEDTMVQDFLYDSEHDWIVGVNIGGRRRARAVPRAAKGITAQCPVKVPLQSEPGTTLGSSPSADIDEFTLSGYPPKFHSTAIPQQRANKRKRELAVPSESSSSDLEQPAPKYGKSELIADDSSFEVEVRRERVDFDVTGSPTLLANELKEKTGSTLCDAEALLETVIGKIIGILPGIRLEERLARLPDLSLQKVADFLAENGYLNHCVLKVFQRTGITRLCLSTSLGDEDGGRDVGEPERRGRGSRSSPQRQPQQRLRAHVTVERIFSLRLRSNQMPTPAGKRRSERW